MHLSGATIAERMFGKYLNLTQTSEHYASTCYSNDDSSSLRSSNDELQVAHVQNENYYEVDLTTIQGVKHAEKLDYF